MKIAPSKFLIAARYRFQYKQAENAPPSYTPDKWHFDQVVDKMIGAAAAVQKEKSGKGGETKSTDTFASKLTN